MRFRRTLAALAGATMLLSACGSDLPSKSEFISQVKESMGSDVTTSLTDAGIDKAKAESIMENFIGCIYDKVKEDEELLKQVYDDGGDKAVESKVEEKAAACTGDLTTAVTEAATAAG